MSAAASRLQSESLSAEQNESLTVDENENEGETLERLTDTRAYPAGPVIAVDLDDVLSQTNQVVADWHNETQGLIDGTIAMDVSMFYYYYYWKNPGWGTVNETMKKVDQFYQADRIFNSKPVPGAREGVQVLRDMGYRLVIVTARKEDHEDESWKWVERHFAGLFDSMICTGQFKDAHKSGHEIVTRLSKSQVCADLGAKLLIDDSSENALQCAIATPTMPVLLFGNYEWNKRISRPSDNRDEMSFKEREKVEGKYFWKNEKLEVPEGALLYKVKDWGEVVQWVKDARKQGNM